MFRSKTKRNWTKNERLFIRKLIIKHYKLKQPNHKKRNDDEIKNILINGQCVLKEDYINPSKI